MSKITIKEIKPAADDKHPTVITDDTGAVMSGFDTALKEVHAGDVLDVELKPKGKYLNIVSFKVLEKAAVSASPGTETSPAREYTRRIEMEIDARYRTTALECAARFVTGENATETTVLGAADEFYHWLRQGAVIPVSEGQVSTPAPRPSASTAGTAETGSNKKAAIPATEEVNTGLVTPPKPWPRLADNASAGAEADWQKMENEKQAAIDAENKQGAVVQQKYFVDWGIIGNDLLTLGRRDPANWSEEAVLAYMLKTYHAVGATPAALAAKLNEGEARHFTNRVKDAVRGKK